MARYYSEADYCAEEMARPYSSRCHDEGGERYVVRKEYEEIDEVERARRGHGHGQLGRSASHHGHLGHGGGHLGHSGSHLGHREHHHGRGYGGSPCDPCENKYESCTGEYYG